MECAPNYLHPTLIRPATNCINNPRHFAARCRCNSCLLVTFLRKYRRNSNLPSPWLCIVYFRGTNSLQLSGTRLSHTLKAPNDSSKAVAVSFT